MRITRLKVKPVFAERIPLKTCPRIELIRLTKISVISRHKYTRKLEQKIFENCLENQLANTEYCFLFGCKFAEFASQID